MVRLGKVDYKNYLKSSWWQKKRRQVKNKFCFICGSVQNLQLHHLTYSRLYGEKNSDLKWLCEEHHDGFHKFTKRIKLKALKSYKRFVLFGVKPIIKIGFNRKRTRNTQSDETASILKRKRDGSKLLKNRGK